MTEFEINLLRECVSDLEYGEVVIPERSQARYQIALSLTKRGYLEHRDTDVSGGSDVPVHLFRVTTLGRIEARARR